MTEKQDREIHLGDLAKKFAGGDKAEAREWLKALRQAVKDGRLEAREKRVSSGSVARFQTVGHTTFAGMPARVVAPTARQAIYESLLYVYHYVTPAAVAAWLHATMPDFEPPALVRAWLGIDWQATATPSPADWGSLSPEEKRAAWETMSPEGRREKAAELVGQHGGNKTAAGREIGISANALRRYLDREEESEGPLPVNRYTVAAGLVNPKRGKDSP